MSQVLKRATGTTEFTDYTDKNHNGSADIKKAWDTTTLPPFLREIFEVFLKKGKQGLPSAITGTT